MKTGKACGRQEGEKRKGYPACRPSRRISDDTPKTASELSPAEREKFKRSKTSSERINYQHRRKEDGGETNDSDMANKPNNPALWSRAKSMAKQKFDVYPSAYANGWAAKWYKSKGGTWRKAEYGMEVPYMEDGGKPEWLIEAQLKAQGYSGNALQQKMSSMAQGGEKMPPEIARARFAAAGNLDKLDEYGYAYGGYIPEMAAGGWAQQAAIAIAMKKAGKKPKSMKDGGDPDGEMALGQIDAAITKLSQLRKFIQPGSDLEPWVNSKLTLMDDYASAVSDYMMYNPEAQEMAKAIMTDEDMADMDMMRDGGIPQRYKNMGFTKVGVKKNSTRPGKKWMVLAKKGDQYKVVHGGYDGMKDFSQHGSEKRKENFWNRMGGKNSSKATDPFSPLYWHKRFGTWQDGGSIVNFLTARGMAADKASRAELAKKYNVQGYDYSAEKNTELLNILRNKLGKAPTPAADVASRVGQASRPLPVVKGKTKSVALPEREVVVDDRNMFQRLFNMNEDQIRRFNLPVDVYEEYERQKKTNKGKNFGIVSKKNARAYFFDPEGGLAVQDEVGFGKDRGDAQPVFYKVMTTPSGTYRMERPKLAAPVADKMLSGYDAKNFFYMDNVDPSKRLVDAPGSTRTSTPRQAMHGLPNHLKAQRSKAFGNKTVDDNYMSAGCINCKRPFLDNPYFDSFQEGLVYVLPEKKSGGSTFSGNAWYNMGGGIPCYECGGMFAYGGIPVNPAGPVPGEEMEVTPEQAEMLRQQGYQFEII